MPPVHVTTSRHGRRKSAAPAVPPVDSTSKRGPIAEMATSAAPRDAVDLETRSLMIAEAAYYRAEKRGFVPGGELQDWLDAECEVESLLRG